MINKASSFQRHRFIFFSTILAAFLLTSCASRTLDSTSLNTVQIIDRNGFNETISQTDRLKQYEKVDFLAPQPYRKAMRVLNRNSEGQIPALITSYHDNGHIWQYLEVMTGRARGQYQEWYPNGQLHIQANVIEGLGDLTSEAQESWIFDGDNFVYNEEGNLVAKIAYNKGQQSGEASYYHPSGALERTVPYVSSKIEGIVKTFDEEGSLIGESRYVKGELDGFTYFKGSKQEPAYEETYREGLLVSGIYFDFQGRVISQVNEGNGEKPLYQDGLLFSLTEYTDGLPEGRVKLFTKEGYLESIFVIKEGMKDGEEIVYYLPKRKTLNAQLQPKLSIQWAADEIHGMVKTWYPNGTLESQREMAKNKKHGMSFAWYSDGSLMLVEEYEEDKLRKGSYMKRGQTSPISKVDNGHGLATLFDEEGNFLKRVKYLDGRPHDA